MAKKDLIYLYCVTDRMPQLKEDIEEIYSVHHQGLYAVVSKVPEEEFGEETLKKNLNDMEWLKNKVSMHERTIEGVMEDRPVVPFKFPTLFRIEDNLKSCLEKYAEGLKKNLKYAEGKEEWGGKIYCDIKRLREVIGKEDDEILRMYKEITSSPPGMAFFLKKKREGLIDKKINEMINMYTQYSVNSLRGQSLQVRVNRLLPKEVTEREEEMILNAAFFVDRDTVKAFIKIVESLRTKYGGSGFSIDCTGPWPPYNFCNFS